MELAATNNQPISPNANKEIYQSTDSTKFVNN